MLNATPIHAQIVNASPQDAVFLKGVVALFTDPQNDEVLKALRTGGFAIVYEPKSGKAYLLPVEHEDAETLPGFGKSSADLINFIARFDHAQWQQLRSTTNILDEIKLGQVVMAEQHAMVALGKLPALKKHKVANG